jgi:hypothetical protein
MHRRRAPVHPAQAQQDGGAGGDVLHCAEIWQARGPAARCLSGTTVFMGPWCASRRALCLGASVLSSRRLVHSTPVVVEKGAL